MYIDWTWIFTVDKVLHDSSESSSSPFLLVVGMIKCHSA